MHPWFAPCRQDVARRMLFGFCAEAASPQLPLAARTAHTLQSCGQPSFSSTHGRPAFPERGT